MCERLEGAADAKLADIRRRERLREEDREEGRREERERIIAWLHRTGRSYPSPCEPVHPRQVLEDAADALGRHR